jgi:oligoribonuclease
MWMPSVRESFVKQGAHLALDDIRESIGEMRHYRDQLLRPDLELVLDASDGSSQG